MSVNGPISPKQCYYEMDYSFYSFYWLDSLEIRLDHNSTYYRSLSKNSDVKPRLSHCDSQNLQYKTHPEFWPSHRRIFKTSLYYKTRLILETRRYHLTHWGRVTHICVSKTYQLWFRQWLVAWPAPSHYLNQCWNIVNWTLGNKLQWNLDRSSYIFIHENAFEIVVWRKAAILSRPQCVNGAHTGVTFATSKQFCWCHHIPTISMIQIGYNQNL